MRRAVDASSLRLGLGRKPREPLSVVGQRVAAVVVAVALAAALVLPTSALGRVLLPLAREALVRSSAKPAGHVVVDGRGVRREDDGGVVEILRWSDPFGVTLLTNRARDRLLFAFTTPAGTRYLGARLAGDVRGEALALAREGQAIPDDEVDLASPEGGAMLSADDAVRLAAAVRDRARDAFGRIYLSALHGEAIELSGSTLRVGARVIDLLAPLECRSFVFHEAAGRVAAVYQATWIRQQDAELVLVAPTPAEAALTGEPPPRELRMAVDRLFMLPLRRALDGAPRIPRKATPRAAESS